MLSRKQKLINSIYRLVVVLKEYKFDELVMQHRVKQKGCYKQEPELKK